MHSAQSQPTLPALASASDAGDVGPRGCRRHKIPRFRAGLSLLLCPNLRPTCPLSCRYSLAYGSRNGSLPPSTFGSVQIDFPEGGQSGGYAVKFVLKSRAFLLELADYRLHQCSWHGSILSLAIRRQDGSCGESLANTPQNPPFHNQTSESKGEQIGQLSCRLLYC